MMTSPEDYDRILHGYVANKLIPSWVSFEMERDYLSPPVQVSNASTFLVKLLGHYSFCNYFECFPPKLSSFTESCRKANIHMDAGLFGYYPLVDRAKGMYMQIATAQVPHSQKDFYAPTIASMVLRKIIKFWVDRGLGLGSNEVSGGFGSPAVREEAQEVAAELLKQTGLQMNFDELWEPQELVV